jgi:alkaline phosphatase
MQDARCKMQDARCKMQDARCKMQDARCKILDDSLHFVILHLASYTISPLPLFSSIFVNKYSVSMFSFNKIKFQKILFISFLAYFSFLSASTQPLKGLPNPKNIIILIGDGMGYNHIKAANYYMGTGQMVYETFPVRLALCHYPAKAGEYSAINPRTNYFATGYNTVEAWTNPSYLKKNVTESAAAATALSTGFKTYNNSVGMSVDLDTLVNLVEWAKSMGKSAGVVTSVEFSHATPAGFVAHNVLRSNYSQIAYEMLLDSRCDVIMGCGNPMFDDDGQLLTIKWKDPKYVGDSAFWVQLIAGSGKKTQFRVNGKMKTVKDVDGDNKPDPWTLIRDLKDFRTLQKGTTPKRVLGVPDVYSTLQQSRSFQNGETKDSPPFITPFIKTVPTLAEMVNGALNVLDNNPKGFFVMIEGGAADWASHDNQKGRLIEEMKSFDEAVKAVVDWVNTSSNWSETLVIVTGDHETGFLWGEEPFTPIVDRGMGNLPIMKFNSTDHTNSLIPFFAKGAGSELYRSFSDEFDSVRGPYIQNSEIPQLIHFLWTK